MSLARYLSISSINLDLQVHPDLHLAEDVDSRWEACEDYDEILDEAASTEEEYDQEDNNEDEELTYAQKAQKKEMKKRIISEMAYLLAASGKIKNPQRLSTQFIQANTRTNCVIGSGVAIPHMRCLDTTTLIMGFARCPQGIDFDAPDEEQVQIFLPMIAPKHDDRFYLKIYKIISKAFLETDIKQELLAADTPDKIIRILDKYAH